MLGWRSFIPSCASLLNRATASGSVENRLRSTLTANGSPVSVRMPR